MASPRQYSPEFRERAVRMVAESAPGSNKRIGGPARISYETLASGSGKLRSTVA
jgi:transposase-like protein